jgi:surfeit locus 1 family protein
MPPRLSAFGKVFTPSWPMTLVTLVLLVAFAGLGRWQWQRGAAKEATWAAFAIEAAAEFGATHFDTMPRYHRVAFHCVLQGERQILLDNRPHAGRPGYEVLTPCALADGRHIIVNRGWVPFTGRRDVLPDITVTGARGSVSGRLEELPVGGLASGRAAPEYAAPWPKVASFPTHEELEAALGWKLERRIVLLDPAEPAGYLREWSPPGIAPERHFSYAIQWWGFAVVLLVLYFGLNFRKVP